MRAAAFCLAMLLSPAVASPRESQSLIEDGTFQIGGGDILPVQHGRFTVPANRHRPGSGTLTLRFVRFSSTSKTPGPPIVFLAGGPGDAATRAFRGMPRPFLDSLRAIADVIAFDQRGTGTSEPRAFCPAGEAQAFDAPLDPGVLTAALSARLRACLPKLASAGIAVDGLTTEESADDVEALRVALGAAHVQLLAGSYGTHLAFAVARRHPWAVARMALLGVEGPNDTLKLPARIDEVLRDIDRAHPGIIHAVETLSGRLRSAPATSTLPDGRQVTVGVWDLQRRVAEALDTTREIEALPSALAAMMAGDYSDLARWSVAFRTPRPINVMNIAMDCASFGSTARLAETRARQPAFLLGTAMNFPLPDVCGTPGLPRLGDGFRAPLTATVPALLVAGAWDARTPPANAHAIAATMSRARVLVVPRVSHDLFQSPQASAALLQFLADVIGRPQRLRDDGQSRVHRR